MRFKRIALGIFLTFLNFESSALGWYDPDIIAYSESHRFYNSAYFSGLHKFELSVYMEPDYFQAYSIATRLGSNWGLTAHYVRHPLFTFDRVNYRIHSSGVSLSRRVNFNEETRLSVGLRLSEELFTLRFIEGVEPEFTFDSSDPEEYTDYHPSIGAGFLFNWKNAKVGGSLTHLINFTRPGFAVHLNNVGERIYSPHFHGILAQIIQLHPKLTVDLVVRPSLVFGFETYQEWNLMAAVNYANMIEFGVVNHRKHYGDDVYYQFKVTALRKFEFLVLVEGGKHRNSTQFGMIIKI